jgi:ppGpp synthetase/RelA/SpoT-type nucleotidyltranferase
MLSFSTDQEKLKKEYDLAYPLYERLVEEVCFVLRDETQRYGIKLHGDVSHRIKTFESLYQKIQRREWSNVPEITDIAGVRIVSLYRSDLRRFEKIIVENFDVLSDSTSRTWEETQFGYMADHYIVRLKQESKGRRYDQIKSLKCEIQVRTVLMDAWASVSHHLAYKREIDIPSELRRDFNAVSGLLYAADTHFELFKDAVEKSRKELTDTVNTNKFDLSQEINLDSLEVYLKWKMPDRERTFAEFYSVLVSELSNLGYKRILELDRMIRRSMTAAETLEAEEMGKKFYTDTGLVKICLLLSNERYRKSIMERFLAPNKRLFELVEKHRIED